ncbi:MAG: hypothetical protein U0003_05590, partial [Vampirovibrionales bacterium]
MIFPFSSLSNPVLRASVGVALTASVLLSTTACNPMATVQEWIGKITSPNVANMSDAEKQSLSQQYFDEGVAAQQAGDAVKARAAFEKV